MSTLEKRYIIILARHTDRVSFRSDEQYLDVDVLYGEY